MFLRFLGTGPAEAIPRLGHTDAACMDARRGGKSRRRRSAAIVTSGRVTVLMDAGPDILDQLREAHLTKIDAVLLTHIHADATGGLPLLDRWAGSRRFSTKLPVLTDASTARRLKKYYPHLECLQFVPIRGFDRVSVGDMAILPFPVTHGDVPTFGYRFGKTLAYASDMSAMPRRSMNALRRVPTLVLDGAFFFDQKRLPSHFATDETIRLAQRLKTKRLIITQIGHTYPPHMQAARVVRSYLKSQGIKQPKVRLAYDGLTIRTP